MALKYTVYIEEEVRTARSTLPGHMRQRIAHMIGELAQEPRPHNSLALDIPTFTVPADIELRRLRLEYWRIIYAVHDTDEWVWILGLRRRPPYDYADLPDIVKKLQE